MQRSVKPIILMNDPGQILNLCVSMLVLSPGLNLDIMRSMVGLRDDGVTNYSSELIIVSPSSDLTADDGLVGRNRGRIATLKQICNKQTAN